MKNHPEVFSGKIDTFIRFSQIFAMRNASFIEFYTEFDQHIYHGCQGIDTHLLAYWLTFSGF